MEDIQGSDKKELVLPQPDNDVEHTIVDLRNVVCLNVADVRCCGKLF